MLDLKVPEGLFGKLAMLPKLAELAKFPPRTGAASRPCQEVVLRGDEVDLGHAFPSSPPGRSDGGRYITLPMVITEDPARGIRNVGMYRVQVLGEEHAGDALAAAQGRCRPLARDGGAGRADAGGDRARRRSGQRLLRPRAAAARPSTSSSSPGSCGASPVELARALTCDLEVPAEAEIVLEGYIDPAEPLVLEGPFGDHTGFYSLADYYPRVHVTAVTMRKRPDLYRHAGRPAADGGLLPGPRHRADLPAAAQADRAGDRGLSHAGLRASSTTWCSSRIDKQYPGQAYKVMNALWGQGLMSLAKVIVVVDKEVNVQDADEAWWVALNNIDPERDVRFTMGPVDVLDHASRGFTYGSKMGIDATRKWKEEGFTREWPDLIEMDEATKARVDAMWTNSASGWRGAGRHRAVPVPRDPVRPFAATRGPDLGGRVAAGPLRQLRQAAAYALRAALRAAGRAGGARRCSRSPCARWCWSSWPSPRRAGWRWGSTGSPTWLRRGGTRAPGTGSCPRGALTLSPGLGFGGGGGGAVPVWPPGCSTRSASA